MKSLAAGLLLFGLFASRGVQGEDYVDCKVKARFSSEDDMGASVIDALGDSHKKIVAALYGFNNLALSDKLIESAKRGVSISIKVDAGKGVEKKPRRS